MWREDIFNNLVRLNRGFDLPEEKIIPGAFPVVASSSIKSFHKEFKVSGPSVVTGRSGSLGVVQYIRDDFWPLNTALYAKDFKGNLPIFVCYFLKVMGLENFNSGAGVPTLNQNHLQKLKIKIPPLPVQKKIAAILSAYDDLIENNKRRIALLEKMAKEIYREWFVRMRFPGHEKVKMVKGVPEGWTTKIFGEFCVLQRGFDLPDSQIVDGQFPVIASTSIKAFHDQFKVSPPVVTTGRSGSLGQVLFVHEKAWPLNTSLYVKNFCGNSPFLIFFTLKNMGLENFNSGAGVPTLNRNHLNYIKINVPNESIQVRFDAVITPIENEKRNLIQTNLLLVRTRDLLLPRLISGKLSVENLDIQFPPSMREEIVPRPVAQMAVAVND